MRIVFKKYNIVVSTTYIQIGEVQTSEFNQLKWIRYNDITAN